MVLSFPRHSCAIYKLHAMYLNRYTYFSRFVDIGILLYDLKLLFEIK